MIIKDHEVFVAATGDDGETASLVGCYHTGEFNGAHGYQVGSDRDFGLERACRHGGFHVVLVSSGGADVLPCLLHVAFGGGDGLGEMVVDEISIQAGPCGEEAGFDGFYPRAGYWAEAAAVEVYC